MVKIIGKVKLDFPLFQIAVIQEIIVYSRYWLRTGHSQSGV